MGDFLRVVAQSDVIFVASGSETLLIHGSDLAGMPAAREAVGSIRRFFDISVPRNVSPDVNEAECSRVFNVDDLKEVRIHLDFTKRAWSFLLFASPLPSVHQALCHD